MSTMMRMEFLKLKRYSVLIAGMIMMSFSVLLSFFYSTANDGTVWTFGYLVHQILKNNCTMFFPIVITLTAGYLISREYTDDTMKNIQTIPISYQELLTAKLLVLLALTFLYSSISWILGVLLSIPAGFPGLDILAACLGWIQITGANIGIYIAVLPILLIFCCSTSGFFGGVALAFLYGYFGTFEGNILNYYPIKAGMILVDPLCGVGYEVSYRMLPAIIVLLLILGASILMLVLKGKKPRIVTPIKKKKEKIIRKKGW